jgi:hypothetical protein
VQGVAREELAEGGEEKAIGRLPARAASLALEDAELVAEGEDLSAQLELGVAAGEECAEEEADQGVEEGERHGRRSCQSRAGEGRRAPPGPDVATNGWVGGRRPGRIAEVTQLV